MATGLVEAVIGELVGAIVGKLGEMAVEQVAKQASLLLHFREDFEWLKDEFTKVRGYLQYEHDQNEAVKKWFADVQDIALDGEDIVQECVVQPLYGKSLVFRWKMGKRVRKLKERMESIMKDLANLVNLNLLQQGCQVPQPLSSHGTAEAWKKSGLLEGDARPVAIDAKVERILHLLEDDALPVIAVVGMGGMGKTFLLQNVFNHPNVPQRFERAIWLSISQVYSVARLQYDIASHLDKDVREGGVSEQRITKMIRKDGVSEQRAAELIYEKLKDKSSLIVLDDVWRVVGVHNLIQRLGILKPCKVVVTTRSIEVCNIMRGSYIYHMELLSEQDSWNLFCLHAFPDDQQNRPLQELDELAHQIERECGRLPLAIKTVAASMASQKVLSTWELKLRQLKEVSDAEDPVRPILRLSYDALPAILKPCFLYFSFFGEDVEIDAEYLICLWIGEGFITGKEEERWSTGWSYLKQLNNLCLVEASEDIGWERLKTTCKIHDLVLDLIISISKETKCAFTVEGASAVGCRRILLAKKGLDDVGISRLKYYPSLRTLSLSQNKITELPTKSLSSVRALRVIDLSYTDISLLPRCVGNFKLLRVLNLSHTGFTEVPYCVRKLKSLCFLNVDTCPAPKWIGNLKCLQHLHVDRVEYSREMSRGISKLVSLKTLRTEGGCGLVLKDVAKLIHLEELQIDIFNEEEGRSLEEGVLAQLVNMRRLTVVVDESPTNLTENMKAMKDLQYLRLAGFSVVPRWICEYGNLKVLKLHNCILSEWPALETMPNLINLWLCDIRGCKELAESFGKSGAFPRLRFFLIWECSELEKLAELQHGAMPRVELFVVLGRGRLQKIPEGFQHLTSLKLLDLSRRNGFSDEERERLKEGGEYWNKIKANNPHVTIKM